MKWLYLPLACLAFASCIEEETAQAGLESDTLRRENLVLRQEVADLKREKDEAVKKADSAIRVASRLMDEKHAAERKLEAVTAPTR